MLREWRALWVPMIGVPPDPRALASTPVPGDEAFAGRPDERHAALPGVAFATPPVGVEAGAGR